MGTKECENECGRLAATKSRYCAACAKEVIKKLVAEGYLKHVPKHTRRPQDQCENVYETKHGPAQR